MRGAGEVHLKADSLAFSRRGRRQVSTLVLREELDCTLDLIHYQFRKRGISYELSPKPKSDLYRDVLPMIRHHHERWDGAGYPDRMSGDAIPMSARILCVADVYDALTTHRPYRPAYSSQEALEAMHADRGRVFDPEVLDRFAHIVASMPAPIAFPAPPAPPKPQTGNDAISSPFAA